MRISLLVPTLCAALATTAAAGDPAAPEAARGEGSPDRALIAIARKISHQASLADVERTTSGLGVPAVEYSRCEGGRGKGRCVPGAEADATMRISLWMRSTGSDDYALFVTSCRTGGEWKVGRVTVKSMPAGKVAAGAQPTEHYEDVDRRFFLKTCWRS